MDHILAWPLRADSCIIMALAGLYIRVIDGDRDYLFIRWPQSLMGRKEVKRYRFADVQQGMKVER